jgi:hypothetical protein
MSEAPLYWGECEAAVLVSKKISLVDHHPTANAVALINTFSEMKCS